MPKAHGNARPWCAESASPRAQFFTNTLEGCPHIQDRRDEEDSNVVASVVSCPPPGLSEDSFAGMWTEVCRTTGCRMKLI